MLTLLCVLGLIAGDTTVAAGMSHRWSEQQWLQGWGVMAQRYAKVAAVVGMGLRNEPRPTFVSECLCCAVLLPQHVAHLWWLVPGSAAND
jgi:hypothetical protein